MSFSKVFPPIFIVDNRQIPIFDFDTDACFASYQRSMMDIIQKSIYLTGIYRYLPRSFFVFYADSSVTTRYEELTFESFSALPVLLEARHSINPNDNNSTNITWGQYILSAIKTANIIVEENRKENDYFYIKIFCNDLNLFGGQYSQSILPDIEKFKIECEKLTHLNKNVKIDIICFSMNSNIEHYRVSRENNNKYLMFNHLLSHMDWIHFEQLKPSSIVIEEQVKSILSNIYPRVYSQLEFFYQLDTSIIVELVPNSLASTESLPYMQNLEIISLTNRNAINPVFIQGIGLTVQCPKDIRKCKLFQDENSVLYNSILYQTLKDKLINKNQILIVKSEYTQPINPTIVCARYWALIPPVNISDSMALIMLYDKDQVILHQTNKDNPIDIEENSEITEIKQEFDGFLDSIFTTQIPTIENYQPMLHHSGHWDVLIKSASINQKKPTNIVEAENKLQATTVKRPKYNKQGKDVPQNTTNNQNISKKQSNTRIKSIYEEMNKGKEGVEIDLTNEPSRLKLPTEITLTTKRKTNK